MCPSFEWHRAKQMLNLDGDDWPEELTIPDIAKLHFPDDERLAVVLGKMLDDALDSGSIEPSGLITAKPQKKGMQVIPLGFGNNAGAATRESYRPKQPPHNGWKDFLASFEIGGWKVDTFDSVSYKVKLKSRFKNGWPKEWELIAGYDNQESHNYIAHLTLSNSSYAAWRDKPPLPDGSLLTGWLESAQIKTKTNDDGTDNEQRVTGKRRQGQRRRKTNLTKAVDAAIKSFGKKPSFNELWEFFQNDKDVTRFIVDYKDTHITWIDTRGKLHDTQKETLANHLSQVSS